jgi:serine/threonine-protein kinase RsbW
VVDFSARVNHFKVIATVPWKYDRRITSDPNNCAVVIEGLLDQLEEFDWGNRDSFAIHMAMEEAIMNAICHGNECCEKKQVHIEMELDSNRFFARVTDEGKGFDPKNLPDPTEDENLTSTSGRGVAMIRHFVDNVNYIGAGNVVELIKTRSESSS